MICLDTNFLILGLVENSAEAGKLRAWHGKGEPIMTSSISWYEFASGPIDDDHIATMRAFLNAGIAAFGEFQAREAARLYNNVGRIRRLRVDAMIAAIAILSDARFATSNTADFQVFKHFGLKLA